MPAAAPAIGRPSPFVIGTCSWLCGGFVAVANGQTVASLANPTANLCRFTPFHLTETRTFNGGVWTNGTVVSGNVELAIYDATGARKATTGSVVQAGTTNTQQAAFSGGAVTLPPGFYFIAFMCDNLTATLVQIALTAPNQGAAGFRQLATTIPLPADASAWVRQVDNVLVLCGIYEPSWF